MTGHGYVYADVRGETLAVVPTQTRGEPAVVLRVGRKCVVVPCGDVADVLRRVQETAEEAAYRVEREKTDG